jgi:hypothetical protein
MEGTMSRGRKTATYHDVKERIDSTRQLSMDPRVLEGYKKHPHLLGRVTHHQVSDDGEYNKHQQQLVDKIVIADEGLHRIEEKFRSNIFKCIYIDIWIKWLHGDEWYQGFGINRRAKCDFFAFIFHTMDWEMLLFDRFAFQTATDWHLCRQLGMGQGFAPWGDAQIRRTRKYVKSIKPTWEEFLATYERFGGENAQELRDKVKNLQAISLDAFKKRVSA